MIRENKDYVKRVKERLVLKHPGVFTHLSERHILVVLNYFTKNMAMAVFKHRHASISNFLNIYPNSNQLFEYRISLIMKKPMYKLWSYFKELKEQYLAKK